MSGEPRTGVARAYQRSDLPSPMGAVAGNGGNGMGASASVSISGVSAAAGTDWAWWGTKKAKAGVYTFTGSAVADAVPAPPPLTAGPAAKFGPGTTAIVWPPLNLSTTGPKGSTAAASMVGSSNVGIAFYGTNVAVSAATSAAAGGGTATASASAVDPWEVTFSHRRGHKSYILFALTPDFSLAPARGSSVLRLFGSFGEITLSLDGRTNDPKATVTLGSGWHVYQHVRLPTVGDHLRPPSGLLRRHEFEYLFLSQHDASAPLWQWNQAAPTLAFVKEVPHSVSVATVEIGTEITDEDADDEEE